MRTTIDLDPDVMRAVRKLATERGVSLGAAISDLIRQALRPPERATYDSIFPVFEVREDAPPITSEMVKAALEED